jgi:ribosomal protein S6 kinase alpha-5
MKVLEKDIVGKEEKTYQHTLTEHHVFEKILDAPFLVGFHYSFQTESKLHLVMGEYSMVARAP